MPRFKDFVLTYEAVNTEGTFSSGDELVGSVSFTLTEQTKVQSLSVKVKGAADVHWTEGSGDHRRSYSDKRVYCKDKQYVLMKNDSGTVLPEGAHSYKFHLKFPEGDMPSSFKGFHGKIVYMLEAKLSRSWHLPSVVQKELNFISKSFLQHGQMMCPQTGTVDKEMGGFSKGQVRMSATADRQSCSPGETVSVVAKVSNMSSKKVTPKFSLQQETIYHAHGHRKRSFQNLCKIAGDTVKPMSEETVSCQLKLPENILPTLHNCDIISVTYDLKVYLDISFAIDPEVVFPLVIVPFSRALGNNSAFGPHAAGAVGGPSYSDFPPPAFPFGPPPAAPGSGVYGCPTSVYTDPFNSQMAPYGFSTAAFPPTSIQHPAPTAPPGFQDEQPPSYTSLFQPPYSSR